MKVILYQPQIPQNTGNIVRTCAVVGSELILVRPLGFSTANRRLKRAGLDYWNDASILEIDHLMDFLEKTNAPFCFFSSRASNSYIHAGFCRSHLLIFGSETDGLPDAFRQRWPDHFYQIPMRKGARCLNLACSVSIALYEACRQTDWFILEETGATTCPIKEKERR